MKILFLAIFVVLALSTGLTMLWDRPDPHRPPEIFWATDLSPARKRQAHIFEEWLVAQGQPQARLLIDVANSDFSKKLIQGVSGVMGDIVDCYDGKAEMQFLQEAGMLRDVTEEAKAMGFSPDQTYPAIAPEIMINGRQYGFPANVFSQMFWVNPGAFERVGQSVPPKRWTLDEFEQRGRAYVDAANPPGQPRQYFFTDPIMPQHRQIFRRSVGVSLFNETLTASRLADPRNRELMERIYRWTYVDRICPSLADASSFSAQGGFWGSNGQLFYDGNYAMLLLGRYALIPLREMGDKPFQVVEPPHGGFPNTLVGARVSAIYQKAKNPELALEYLKFLTSPAYNDELVLSADAMPPVPSYAETESFRQPPAHPTEWGTHQPFLDAVNEIGIVNETSPFILPRLASRIEQNSFDSYMAGLMDAKTALADADRRMSAEIERYLAENPGMRAEFKKRQATQIEIDKRLAAGQKIPASWIANPFHQKYYASLGLLDPAL